MTSIAGRSRRLASVAVVGCLSFTVACSDSPYSPLSGGRASVQAPQSLDEARAELVTKAFAMAMQDASVRVSVRDAMRASRITEHKLILADFVRSDAGSALVTAAAAAFGVTNDSLVAVIAALPAMDFYVPSRDERRNWQGQSNISVGHALRADKSSFTAFDVTDVRQRL